MRHDDLRLRDEWERRAAAHHVDRRGVLFGGLPDAVNEAIDRWHVALVKKYLFPGLKGKEQVLDLASGYGRLSRIFREAYAEIGLVGVDFSLNYCRLYAQFVGRSVRADLRQLPFHDERFDRIIAVTGLMYLDLETCEQVVPRIIAGLKPGGVALFVDPGAEMISFLRRLRPSLARRGTGGKGFGMKEYLRLLECSGGDIIGRGGNSCFTLLLPLLLLCERWPGLVSLLAGWAERVDMFFGGWGRLAMHRWVVFRRET